ncbi:MAG: molybdate ABC transporter permease subunit, partial [Chthoniobacterales bacterium]
MLSLSNNDWWTIGFSLWTAALAILIILPFGIATGWLFARKQWMGKSVAETLVTLPLVMPPVATGLILLELFG